MVRSIIVSNFENCYYLYDIVDKQILLTLICCFTDFETLILSYKFEY